MSYQIDIPRALWEHQNTFKTEVTKEMSHSPKFFRGSVFLLEYTDVCNLLLTVIMITSLERNTWKKERDREIDCVAGNRGETTISLVHTIYLSFQNKNFNYEAQTAVSSIKNLTFLESEELSSKPNTMCCICIKTASATVYAYRFHSCI